MCADVLTTTVQAKKPDTPEKDYGYEEKDLLEEDLLEGHTYACLREHRIHTCTYMYVLYLMPEYIHMHVYLYYMPACMHVCMYLCISACIYNACMHACVFYAFMLACMYDLGSYSRQHQSRLPRPLSNSTFIYEGGGAGGGGFQKTSSISRCNYNRLLV